MAIRNDICGMELFELQGLSGEANFFANISARAFHILEQMQFDPELIKELKSYASIDDVIKLIEANQGGM